MEEERIQSRVADEGAGGGVCGGGGGSGEAPPRGEKCGGREAVTRREAAPRYPPPAGGNNDTSATEQTHRCAAPESAEGGAAWCVGGVLLMEMHACQGVNVLYVCEQLRTPAGRNRGDGRWGDAIMSLAVQEALYHNADEIHLKVRASRAGLPEALGARTRTRRAAAAASATAASAHTEFEPTRRAREIYAQLGFAPLLDDARHLYETETGQQYLSVKVDAQLTNAAVECMNIPADAREVVVEGKGCRRRGEWYEREAWAAMSDEHRLPRGDGAQVGSLVPKRGHAICVYVCLPRKAHEQEAATLISVAATGLAAADGEGNVTGDTARAHEAQAEEAWAAAEEEPSGAPERALRDPTQRILEGRVCVGAPVRAATRSQ